MQEGLYSLSRDFDATLFRDSMLAHAALGQAFPDLPVVLTTSSQAGLSILSSKLWLGPFGVLPSQRTTTHTLHHQVQTAPCLKKF